MFETSAQRGRFIIIVLTALWILGFAIPALVIGDWKIFLPAAAIPAGCGVIWLIEVRVLDWWEGD